MRTRNIVVATVAIVAVCMGLFGHQTTAIASTKSDKLLERQIRDYLRSKGSPLAQYAHVFVVNGKRFGVDPRFVVAISGGETSFATNPAAAPASTVGHNAWGIGPGWHFNSWEHGIKYANELLGRYYRDRRTIAGVRHKWAPSAAANDPGGLNEHWVTNVSHYYKELGGNPNGNVFIVPSGNALKKKPSREVTEIYTENIVIPRYQGDAQQRNPSVSDRGFQVKLSLDQLLILMLVSGVLFSMYKHFEEKIKPRFVTYLRDISHGWQEVRSYIPTKRRRR